MYGFALCLGQRGSPAGAGLPRDVRRLPGTTRGSRTYGPAYAEAGTIAQNWRGMSSQPPTF
jgi:hypothetical protein